MTRSTPTLVFALLATATAPADPRFPARVVDFAGLGSGLYGDPAAVLGEPASWIRDPVGGGPEQRVAVSLVYGAWNVDPAGRPVVTTIRQGGWITVEFDPPLVDDPRNWFGKDFIVFGNAFLATGRDVTWNTDMGAIAILPGPDWIEPMRVSVSNDGFLWFDFPLGPYSGADGYWPTQAFFWDRSVPGWGGRRDFTRPVPPNLAREALTGLSVADALERLGPSAGGTAFDLAAVGLPSARYVRIYGHGGEVDAIVRVSPRSPAPGPSPTRFP